MESAANLLLKACVNRTEKTELPFFLLRFNIPEEPDSPNLHHLFNWSQSVRTWGAKWLLPWWQYKSRSGPKYNWDEKRADSLTNVQVRAIPLPLTGCCYCCFPWKTLNLRSGLSRGMQGHEQAYNLVPIHLFNIKRKNISHQYKSYSSFLCSN